MNSETAGYAAASLARSSVSTFLSYYPNRHQSIKRGFDAENWLSLGKFTYLSDEQILEAVEGKGSGYRGLRWDRETRFSVLDIDSGSEYHNPHSLKRLSKSLSKAGIANMQKYQSSASGGWHLYIPFDRFCSSGEIESLLKGYLKSEGFKVISGQLEIFPSGNGLRLPLQKGFAWLADDGSLAVKREDLSSEQAIKKFVLDMEYGANDWEVTKLRINERLEEHRLKLKKQAEIDRQLRLSTEGLDELFTGRIIQENYDRGKRFFREGLKSKGERHDAVICVEHYLWHGDEQTGLRSYAGRGNDYERYEAILSWLKKNHNGFCNHINRGDWKTIEAQVKRAVEWRSEEVPERTPYIITSDVAIDRMIALTKSTGRTWKPEDWKKANERRMRNARKRIEAAVEQIRSSGDKLSIRKVALVSGCHRSTVKKHFDLLSSGLSDLEPGGVGGSCGSGRPAEAVLVPFSSSVFIPPAFSESPGLSALVGVSFSSVFSFLLRLSSSLPLSLFSAYLNYSLNLLSSQTSSIDPELGLSKDSFLVFNSDPGKYIEGIALSDDTEAVVSIVRGLSQRKGKKELSRKLRMVVFENGQLAIDFESLDSYTAIKQNGRGPP